MRPRERFLAGGFTLLEVMAAVAVLGLVYVVVARGAMQGLQTEGDSGRRLRASLLADRVLNDLELDLAGGSAPKPGRTEASEEEFTVVVEVSPFDVETVLPPEPQGEPASSTLELLKPSAGGAVPTLLSISVRVAWTEGVDEEAVTRSSFAFDLEAATPLLEQIESEAQQQGSSAGLRRRSATAGATE